MKQLILIESLSSDETEQIASELASVLRPNDVVALYGPLGAGKTTFVRGLARGLGCLKSVRSPSFSLINEYPGPIPLYHIDFYRLEWPGRDRGFRLDRLSRFGRCGGD